MRKYKDTIRFLIHITIILIASLLLAFLTKLNN